MPPKKTKAATTAVTDETAAAPAAPPPPKTSRKKNAKREREPEEVPEPPEVIISDEERDRLVSEAMAKYPANPLRALWETLIDEKIKATSVAMAIINSPSCGVERRATESDLKQTEKEAFWGPFKVNAGATPLLMAARAGRADVVKALLNLKVDTKVVDKHGRTALHMAAESDSFRPVKALIDHGVEIDVKDANGKTPLFAAARSYHDALQKVSALLTAGANAAAVDAAGRSILHLLLDAPVAKLLIEKGANPNAAANGITPLIQSAMDGSDSLAEVLMKLGADPEARDNDGCTALYHAAQRGDYPLICSLIKGGAKTSTRDAKGHKPLIVFMNACMAYELELHDYEMREIARKLTRLCNR